MEIQTIVFEHWMCRICLGQGSYNIFEDHLLPATAETAQHQQPQGRSNNSTNSVSIVDALNYFCEFKISPSEIVNEPIMLCEGCCAALLQCYQFRSKVRESESLLRSRDTPDLAASEAEDTKTGLTLQLADIEPFLEDVASSEDVTESLAVPPAKPPKIHHAKPRFQLTNQVSNILRHVAASSGVSEKRKDLDDAALESSTPKKIQRRNDDHPGVLEQTLIVPNYIFAAELDEDGEEEKTILLIEQAAVSPSSQIQAEPPAIESPSETIAYCKHCPKAFSTPYHLLAHTKSTHLCQHCLKHLPNAKERNRHVREEHKTFRCTLCSFQTPYVANLRSHLRRTHSVALPAHVSILQSKPEEVPTAAEGNK